MPKKKKLAELSDDLFRLVLDSPESPTLAEDFEAALQRISEFEVEFDEEKITHPGSSKDVSSPRIPLPEIGTTRITIRIPRSTILAFKTKALQDCVPYQRLINRAIVAAIEGWAH